MSDFNDYNERELDTILKFTETLADGLASSEADLEQARQQAKAYIEKRNLGLSGKVQEAGEEADDIRESVRSFLKRRQYAVK